MMDHKIYVLEKDLNEDLEIVSKWGKKYNFQQKQSPSTLPQTLRSSTTVQN